MNPKYLIIFLLTASLTSLFSQDKEEVLKMWKNPTSYLETIHKEIEKADTGWEAEEALGDHIQGLAYAINQELIYAKSKDWGTPSPDRIRVIQKWGEILAPYTKELLVLAMEERKTRERSSTQARSILDFAAPTKQFEEEVRTYVGVEKINTVSAAIDLLYEHRLANELDMEVLRESIKKNARNPDEEAMWNMSLSGYGMIDGIEKAREILRSTPKTDSYEVLISQYSNVLSFMVNLGPKADSLLPDLDALITKLKGLPLGQFKSGLLSKFEYARDFLIGKNPVDIKYAKNGSGLLTLKPEDLPQQRSQDEQSKIDTPRERPEKPRPSVAREAPGAIPKENALYPWGIIGSLIALLAMAFVAWLQFRKSKPTS